MKEVKVIPKTARTNVTNEKWFNIKDCVLISREHACPKREIRDDNTPLWVNNWIRKLQKKEKSLRKHAKIDANYRLKKKRVQKWKDHHVFLRKEMKKAKVTYESNQLLKLPSDAKVLFNKVKRSRNVNIQSPPIISIDGKVLKTDAEKADAFQDRFLSVFTPMKNDVIDWPEVPGGLNNVNFTPSSVKAAISKMKRNAAPGPDGIGPAYYKEADISLIFALCDLYTHCMDNTEFPDDFLCSKVITLWKNKGSISDIKTHRGITLCNIPVKICESVILNDINDHLENFNMIDDFQHGFQKRRSTITNLLETWEFISKQVDQGQGWVSLSADFSCAFDTLSIFHLLQALKTGGIGGKLGKFLDMWLRNRSQYVQIGDSFSRVGACSSGVAQGSLTGPQLFCVLLSSALKTLSADIAEKINLKMLCFADDTRFLFQSKDQAQADLAQNYINDFVSAVSNVGLKINPSKSIVVYYGVGNYVQNIKIDNVVVPVESSSLELGCILSNTMNFRLQLERNISKASRFIFMIRNSFSVRTYDVLEKLYIVYFIPILLYSSQVWLTDFEYMKEALY